MKYKAVLFDLDDTLIKSSLIYRKSLSKATQFLCNEYELDFDSFYKIVLRNHHIVRNNFPTVHTRHSRILVFKRALDEFVHNYDLGLLPKVEQVYWNFFLENIELYPNVIETLVLLRENNIKVGVVSDGDLSLRIRKIGQVGLIPHIDELVCSEEVIFEKPFSAIFTLALSRLEVEPDEALMVGNNYKNDIKGAQLVGMEAALFNPIKDGNIEGQNGHIEADFEFENYSELAKKVLDTSI